MIKVKIELENETKIFAPGSVISGRIKCYCTSAYNIKDVVIKIRADERSKVAINNKYFRPPGPLYEKEIYLFSSGFGKKQKKKGFFWYSFHFALPPRLPSTFYISSGQFYSCISYYLKAYVITERHTFLDIEDITVESMVTLNEFEREFGRIYSKALEETISRSLSCKEIGNIVMSAKFTTRSLVPGDCLNFQITITNKSTKDFSYVIYHVQLRVLHKHNKNMNVFRTLDDTERVNDYKKVSTRVPKREQKSFDLELRLDENFMPLNSEGCRFMHFSYEIVIRGFLGMFYSVLELIVPIKIGEFIKEEDRKGGEIQRFC